jgi:hypothetical protein
MKSERPIKIESEKARGGVVTGRMVLVLSMSLALALVVMILILSFVYA